MRENKDWEKRFDKLVVGEGTKSGSIPPVTMGELLIQSDKPNTKPLKDFIQQEISRAREEAYKEGARDMEDYDWLMNNYSRLSVKQAIRSFELGRKLGKTEEGDYENI